MARTRRVYKYATGQDVPAGAVYLCTKVQELPPELQMRQHEIGGPTWLVWHYYEVEVDA